jgi:hypothetical protein
MIKLENIPHLLRTIARLHNYCLRNGEVKKKILKIYRVRGNMQLPHEPQTLSLKCPVSKSLRLALEEKRKSLFA